MPPKPTPPEGESSEIPKTETVFISSNSEKATKLCGVCSSIPAWFWTRELGIRENISVELQPFKEMRAEAQNGCCLCQMLCSDNLAVWMNFQSVSRDTLLALGTVKLAKSLITVADQGKQVYGISCRFEAGTTTAPVYVYPISSSWRSFVTADKNANILLMEDWLSNCRLNHVRCNNVTKDFLPTRLLDLEAFNRISPDFKDDIKLVHSASSQLHGIGSVPHYITLSHCWGPPEKRPVTTTHANLAVRMERISFADLPRTFQDAVVITRRLGQRYLWIDSLCIIQDDEDDWANEASMMAKVYAQSYLTLAALSSTDSTGGLRMPTKVPTDEDFVIDLGANNDQNGLSFFRLLFDEQKEWQEEYNGDGVEKSPLRYRAWALQEKELSTRTIHFGSRQLLWECRELKGTSQLPWCQRGSTWGESQLKDFMLYHSRRVRWLDLSQEYSARSLTNKTDKLPALSGIARSFQDYFPNDKYIAGMWSSHLPLALLWQPSRDAKKWYTTDYIAPSWSWTSHPTRITYHMLELSGDLFRKTYMASKTLGPVDKWVDELKVVKITGQPKHGDDYGALEEGASLELKGALLFELDSGLERAAELDSDLESDGTEIFCKNEAPVDSFIFFKNGVPAGCFLPDVLGQFPDVPGLIQGKFVCLGVSYSEFFKGVLGLILREHIRDGGPVYSRVGYVSQLDPSLWDGSERRQITLI